MLKQDYSWTSINWKKWLLEDYATSWLTVNKIVQDFPIFGSTISRTMQPKIWKKRLRLRRAAMKGLEKILKGKNVN